MSEKDYLITLFGKAAEVLVRMAALVHQIMKQGGQAEDINLLNDDRVMKRVAEVLAKAGRLKRPFHITVGGEVIEIFLIGLKTKRMADVENGLPGKDVCRFARYEELVALHHENLDLLDDEDELLITGEKLEGKRSSDQFKNGHDRWTLSKKKGGVRTEYFADDAEIQGNWLFAVAFKESKKLKKLEEFLNEKSDEI